MPYLYAFAGFALLIILHEAGHFAAAKAVGMRVERFSLFFGQMLVKRRIGETEYGVGWLPLGGYVKISGMTSGEVFESAEDEARAYINQPVWKRIVVIAAGPAVNLVLAFILAWVFFVSTNHPVYTASGAGVPSTQIAAVQRGMPASGVLRPGDVLVSVDGVRRSAQRMHAQIRSHVCAGGARVNGCEAATSATLVVRREGNLRTFRIRPRYSTKYKEPLVGFQFAEKTASDGPAGAVGQSASGLWHATSVTVSDIAQLFKPKERRQLSGPVGAYAITAREFQSGFATGTEVLALISLSLGLINLFPFLPLDGGHIFWAIVEKLRGRRVPIATMERAGMVGVALIVLLFVIGLSNDISSLTSPGGFGAR